MPRTPDEVSGEVLSLLTCQPLGPASIWRMAERCGSLDAARHATAAQWNSIDRLPTSGAEIVQALAATDPVEERRRMHQAGTQMVLYGDADFPALIAQVPVPPVGLWMRGTLDALGPVPVAVVGARNASAYGLAQAGRFAGRFAEEGIAVVSGGARGIDAEAHRAALRAGGATVAIVGCGLGTGPYPPEHGDLYAAIVDAGGLILSEFPSHWPVLPENFPRRNRIIAGASVATVVIEAGVGSGALITARHAADDQNRPVFAVPGPVDSKRSEGCNRAIRDDLARIVLDPADVLAAIQAEGVFLAVGARERAEAPAVAASGPLAAAVAQVQRALRKERGADCGRIVEITGLAAHEVQAALTMLEIQVARGGKGAA